MIYTDVLIDLDDTLIDTVENTRLTISEIYNDYNLGSYFPSFEDFYAIYVANVSQLWELYSRGKISKANLQRERFIAPLSVVDCISDEQALAINDDFIARVMLKDTLIDGAKELLDYLQPKYRMHILSNGFTEMQYNKMEVAGLSSYFDKVILSDKVGVNKPHPNIFHYALNEIGVDKRDVIMIGDNIFTDIGGAYNIGIDQIWFNPQGKESVDIQPAHIVKRLKDIQYIL